MQTVQVRRHVRRVNPDENHYAGSMVLGGVKIDFELVYVGSVSKILKMPDAEILVKAQALFGLKMKKDDRPVLLDDHEFRTFAIMCHKSVVHAQTINSQIKSGTGVHDTIVTSGILKAGLCLLTPVERKAFKDKFGCELPD